MSKEPQNTKLESPKAKRNKRTEDPFIVAARAAQKFRALIKQSQELANDAADVKKSLTGEALEAFERLLGS